MNNKVVMPGDKLGLHNDYKSGNGTYLKDNEIISALYGKIIITNNELQNKPIINVIAKINTIDMVPRIGDTVICQITRIQINQVFCDILFLGDYELKSPAKGVIRKEDVREFEKDKVVLTDTFIPGDLLKAVVLSLGDSKYLYLTTANDNLGIVARKSKS